jgi:hypothetical protein
MGLNMTETSKPIFSSAAVSAIAANAMFLFHVEPLPTGEFCVYADTFPIEDYRTEIEAKALCKRLIAQQSRDARKGRLSLRRGLASLSTPVF